MKELLLGVVPAEAERALGQVVGTEGEELRQLCDFSRVQTRTHDLGHRAEGERDGRAQLIDDLVHDLLLDESQLLQASNVGDHDLDVCRYSP